LVGLTRSAPSTWTRRIGAACETAQVVVPPAGAMARFSTERQKLISALPLSWMFQPLSASTLPVMRTSSGPRPRPCTAV